MISWMQRHRKYLVITIWISTIAFVGAGFVGWGQYSYGDKAGAVAQVGDVSITQGEYNQAYSRMYNQYNQIFQGNFDEAQAKSFGLPQQALRQLIEQALVLNLAQSYSLRVTDKELLTEIQKQEGFFDKGHFSKERYQKVLSQNNMNMKDYEVQVRKGILLQKTLALFTPTSLPIEESALGAALNIADKVNYKVLDSSMLSVDNSDAKLKEFWQTQQQSYMTLPSFTLEVLTQKHISANASDAEIAAHYNENKQDFINEEGMLLTLEEAKTAVISALDALATRKKALRQYINFKKAKLDANTTTTMVTLDQVTNTYPAEIFTEIQSLTIDTPYLKPRAVGEDYLTFKLVKVSPSVPKSFEAAKEEVKIAFMKNARATQLQELAQNSLATFNGKTTPFVTRGDVTKLSLLNAQDAAQFLNQLFEQDKKRGTIQINENKIVLFNILEQKLLDKPQIDQETGVMRIKSSMLDRGLIKMLENKYKTEIFIQGL